jgi:hypothetical protein
VASRLGGSLSDAAVAARDGRWRRTGPRARAALFVLGMVATGLLLGILGFRDEITLLVGGLVALAAAEWLTLTRRLFASGIEEGLSVTGALLVGLWITTLVPSGLDWGSSSVPVLLPIAAVAAAGFRRLNPFVTTCAAVTLVYWVGSTPAAHALDSAIGVGMTTFGFACASAALALGCGARRFRRPSHDRMLDGLVAVLPVTAYAHGGAWSRYTIPQGMDVPGGGPLTMTLVLLALAAAMLFAGLRRRRHAPLLGFLGCVACLAIEIYSYTGLANETWLIACGLAALVAGVALDRHLRVPRDGLTSAALEDREGPIDLLQTAGAAVLAQRTTPQSPAEPGYGPGEGRFGGGGASGSY